MPGPQLRAAWACPAAMLARLPALALVALGAVDALPAHEPEPLAPPHHHHAAHVDAKHGSVLDGLRELVPPLAGSL